MGKAGGHHPAAVKLQKGLGKESGVREGSPKEGTFEFDMILSLGEEPQIWLWAWFTWDLFTLRSEAPPLPVEGEVSQLSWVLFLGAVRAILAAPNRGQPQVLPISLMC